MTVTLTPEQEKFIAEQLNKGAHSSPEMVLDEGLKLIQLKEEYERRLAELRRDLQIGIDQLNRGETVDGRQVIDRLLQKNAERSRAQT
jgi:antitoxin ParD1/3/4